MGYTYAYTLYTDLFIFAYTFVWLTVRHVERNVYLMELKRLTSSDWWIVVVDEFPGWRLEIADSIPSTYGTIWECKISKLVWV